MAYVPGDTVRLPATIRDAATNALVDPLTLVFKVKNARTKVVTTYTYGVAPNVGRDSLGVFHCDVFAPDAGQWAWRLEVTGAVAGAEQGTFFVDADVMT